MFHILTFIGGLCIGSFLNVVILRGPSWWRLAPSAHTDDAGPAGSRSQCASCRMQLKAWHLVPVFSWLFLRARCAFCGARISFRYPLIELAGGLATLSSVWLFGWTLAAAAAFVFICLVLAAAMIDLDTGYLPDALTLPLIGLGLAVNAVGLIIPFAPALIGAAAGYGIFWLIRFAYARLRGMEGLGLGDAKLLAGLGAWLGWAALPLIVLVAALGGLATVGLMALSGRSVAADTPVRFGPFLGLGGLVAMALLAGGLPIVLLYG